MKITIVGQWAGYPEANEASSGYLFQMDGYNLLVDCGSGVLSKLQRYIALEELNGVIISHYHHDHVADVGPLHYARQTVTQLGRAQEELTIYGHSYDEDGFKRLSMEPYVVGVPYDGRSEIALGPFKISFCETEHPIKCFAMRIRGGEKSVVYTGDTSYFPELVEFSKEADLLLCECSFYKGQDGKRLGHMTSSDAAILAREAKVKEIVLTHLPHFGNINELAEDAKENFSGKVRLAEAGMVIQ